MLRNLPRMAQPVMRRDPDSCPVLDSFSATLASGVCDSHLPRLFVLTPVPDKPRGCSFSEKRRPGPKAGEGQRRIVLICIKVSLTIFGLGEGIYFF